MTAQNSNDQSLLIQMKNGSMEAFEQLYMRFVALIFNIAYRMTGNRMDAEDICHDVFLEVLCKADRYDPSRGSIEAWLAVMTRSRCLDRLRKQKRIQWQPWEEYAKTFGPSNSSTEETVLTKLDIEQLRTAIRRMPENQRKAVYGMYFHAYSHNELAQAMNRPLGTIKSYIRYGVNHLKKQLNPEYYWHKVRGRVNHNEPS